MKITFLPYKQIWKIELENNEWDPSDEFKVELDKITENSADSNSTTVSENELQATIKQSLQTVLLKNKLQKSNDKLPIEATFQPLRPFSCMTEIKIVKHDGCAWICKMRLDATEPDVDDIIKIESQINRTSSIAFHLCNIHKYPSPFHVIFCFFSCVL